MEIKVGEKYQTRDGNPISIYCITGAGHYPIQGSVYTTKGGIIGRWPCKWSTEGICGEVDLPGCNDIVPEIDTCYGWRFSSGAMSDVYRSTKIIIEKYFKDVNGIPVKFTEEK